MLRRRRKGETVSEYIGKLIKGGNSPEMSPAALPHPDGFVYKVVLEYRIAPDKTPFISITDDGNITGAKICSAESNSYFVAQFGGEEATQPLFAHIYFTSANLQKKPWLEGE